MISDEKRKYQRALFQLNDGVLGVFAIPGVKYSKTAHILNLSLGGMYFTLQPEERNTLQKGKNFVLLQIKGSEDLEFLVNIDAEVKWIMNHEMFEHVGIGCEFIYLGETSQKLLGAFVYTWNEDKTDIKIQ